MKKIIIALILVLTSFGYSQNCKYEKNEFDEFTKNKILETKEELFFSSGLIAGYSCSYTLKKINDTRYLKLGITAPSIFSVIKGQKVMFKTDKENTIDLEFIETVIAESQYSSISKSTNWGKYIILKLSEENYNRFLNENILKLRVYTTDGYFDDDIKEKRAKKFKENLKCIE